MEGDIYDRRAGRDYARRGRIYSDSEVKDIYFCLGKPAYWAMCIVVQLAGGVFAINRATPSNLHRGDLH